MKGKKTGGRTKGTPNKTTEELRGLVQNFLENNIERLQEDFDLLEPKDRLNFIEKIMKLVIPAPITSLEQLSEYDLDILIEKLKMEAENESKI